MTKSKQFIYIEHAQGSPEWIAFRQGRIGGSDVPSIMEVPGAYKSRAQLLQEKITNVVETFDAFTQKIFADGHAFEIGARQLFSDKMNDAFIPVVIQSITNELHIASLDGFNSSEDRILEIKSTRKKEYISLAAQGLRPEVYEYQIQWQLFVAGCNNATLLVVNSMSGEMIEVKIGRNQGLIDDIVVGVNKFITEMLTQIAPFLYLETVEMRVIAGAKMQIKEYQNQIKDIEAVIKKAATDLLNHYGATKIEGFGTRIQMIEKVGSVNYKKIPELKNVDLDKYRARPTSYVKISEINESKGNDDEN